MMSRTTARHGGLHNSGGEGGRWLGKPRLSAEQEADDASIGLQGRPVLVLACGRHQEHGLARPISQALLHLVFQRLLPSTQPSEQPCRSTRMCTFIQIPRIYMQCYSLTPTRASGDVRQPPSSTPPPKKYPGGV